MSEVSRIFLVGLMGAGKSTVGRLLARDFGLAFVDSDHEIEARSGVPVATIFELEGEAGFRARERRMIEELTRRESIVLATGGGAVIDADNRRDLAGRGFVVYLHTRPENLFVRLKNDRSRPLLQTANPRGRLAQLYRERDVWYREVADLVVETGRQSASKLARQIGQQIRPNPEPAAEVTACNP
ncbi:MAG: shikimate kinase [Betaproteobacteria bacterium]|jgi:shikimate kinase|nr:shikimate kinase [Betaproteobacteria bacterium]NBT05853.1 shikimate kinase [Betaproteobacteria bacterium]NBY52846.1 shikimate kinase [Betaproteobacteria bacterium]NCU84845.1 shikimate kinase [Betaproteobacteria bacterium]